MLNEIYINMYRVAVTSGRLPIEFIPDPYRTAIKNELEAIEPEPEEIPDPEPEEDPVDVT